MSFLIYVGELFNIWFSIFAAPLKNFEMLWIIIPVYLNWMFTEIYQEKKFTSLGNAISNGTVVLWAGIDWIRHIARMIGSGNMVVNSDFFIKIFISLVVLSYGFFVIYTGIKEKRITHYIGRIREVSYVLLMFTPMFYGVIHLSWKNLFVIILFMPLFYFIIEILNRITPDPGTYKASKEYEEEKIEKKAPDIGGGLGFEEPAMPGSEQVQGSMKNNASNVIKNQNQRKSESDIDEELRKLGLG